MPRTLQEIVDHADELAAQFENYEPNDADRISAEEINTRRLRQAAVARAQAEQQVADAVTAARADGVSWRRIGEQLGTSAQATQKRYAVIVNRQITVVRKRAAAARAAVARRTRKRAAR